MAAVHIPAQKQDRRRMGLALMLGGLALATGGFFLPWLSVGCAANCTFASWAPTRGPIATEGLFLFICWPAWLLVLVLAFLTALQEARPASRRGAAPALLLAGMLLVVQVITLLLLAIAITRPGLPVLTFGLLPGSAVSPLGALLVAVGGWLRYHPARADPSRPLAEVPAER